MKRFFYAAFVAALLSGSTDSVNVASAQDSWIFLPSYYSHDPTTSVRIGRQYSRGPVYTRPEGEFVNSGYRRTQGTIQVGGRVFDQVNMIESWIQVGRQF